MAQRLRSGAFSAARALVALALVALVVLTTAATVTATSVEYSNIAKLDGTRQVTAADYRNGLNTSDGANIIAPCELFSHLGGNFVVRVVMGIFTDYFIPTDADVSVCDLLTARAADGRYRYASSDPTAASWDGYSDMVGLASQWPNALGGAPFSYLATSGAGGGTADRSTIAFWGYDDDDVAVGGSPNSDSSASSGERTGHRGGCCAHSVHEPPSWYQSLSIDLAPMDPAPLYLVWTAKPAAIVLKAPIVFMAKLWNFRGEPASVTSTSDNTLTVNLDDRRTVTVGRNKRAGFVVDQSTASSEFDSIDAKGTFVLTISTTHPDLPAARSSRSLRLPVWASFPAPPANSASAAASTLSPCTTATGVPRMLHFGAADYGLSPVSRFSSFDNDWFAAASLAASGAAGEAYLRPVLGHKGIAEADPSLAPSIQEWTELTAPIATGLDAGTFSSKLQLQSPQPGAAPDAAANGTLQFFAFTLYSVADQTVVFQVAVNEAWAFLLDHAEVQPPLGSRTVLAGDNNGPVTRNTFAYHLKQGYHQVLIKLFSSSPATSGYVSSSLNFKVFGTGVAYALERPSQLPEGAYEMISNTYMFSLLTNGKTADDMLYTSTIDEDLISVHKATPRRGELVVDTSTDSGEQWNQVVFYSGNIVANGSAIPADKSYAVKYVALALYNPYDVAYSVDWKLLVRGHTEFYMDGLLQYSARVGTEDVAVFATALQPGWHQLIVRVAARRAESWLFRFYMAFTGVRAIGALEIGARSGEEMPFGLRRIIAGVPLQAMLELTRKNTAVTSSKLAAMIMYNASSEESSAATYLSPGLQLTAGNGGGAYTTFEAYKSETITLASETSPGATGAFEWVPTTKLQDGVWGHVDEDRLAGGYYRLWAFSMYAAAAGTVQADAEFVGGLAVWLNGAVVAGINVASDEAGQPREALLSFSLRKGWNQVVVKLQVPSTFSFGETKELYGTGWENWLDVTNVCKTKYGSAFKTCPSEAYCPFGSVRVGADLPRTPHDAVTTPNAYAPVSDAEDTFIQLMKSVTAAPELQPQPLCSLHRFNVGAGTNLTMYGAGKFIGCCKTVRTPSFLMTFRVPAELTDRLGYTYHELIAIANPRIAVDRAYLSVQTVTITTATPGAGLRYRLASTDGWTDYTGSFPVAASCLVQAQAYVGSRTSGTTSLAVKIPGVTTVDRTHCVYEQPCPLTFTGAPLGGAAALVARAIGGKPAKAYESLTFAKTQERSEIFSGVANMANDTLMAFLRVLAPAREASHANGDEFVIIVYDGDVGTQVGFVTMHGALTLSPSAVVASTEAAFQLDTYLQATDTVLFPQVLNEVGEDGKPLTTYYTGVCSMDECRAAVVNYAASAGSPVTASRTFRANLRAAPVSRLTCLCVCASCRDRYPSGDMGTAAVVRRGHVGAVPVTVDLYGLSSSAPTTTTPQQQQPPEPKKSRADLLFVILIPILVVLIVVVVGVVICVRLRRRHAERRKLMTALSSNDTAVDGVGERSFGDTISPTQSDASRDGAVAAPKGDGLAEGSANTEEAAPSYLSSSKAL